MNDSGEERFWPVTLDNSWIVEYATDAGGVLRIDPATIRAAYRLRVERIAESSSHTRVFCLVRLADNEGRLWQAESAFSADVFLRHLIDLGRKEPPHLARNLPQPWREALNRPCLAEGTYAGYDHRSYRYFYLDGKAWFVRFKYQGAYHDLYPLDGGRILVRSRTLYAEGWNPLPLEDEAGLPLPAGAPYQAPDYEEDEEAYDAWADSDEHGDGNVPDLFHEMDIRPLLFRARLPLNVEAFWDSDLPAPVVFRRVAGEDTPQPAVRLRGPAPAAPLRPALPGEFVSWNLENQHELDLRTNAAGVLHLGEDGPITPRSA
jgi:hypothetical protein